MACAATRARLLRDRSAAPPPSTSTATTSATSAPGEFFGELAALDWGAGFGYARSATVTARTDLTLLALAPAHLEQLMRLDPSIADAIHGAIRTQLAAT